MEHESDGQLGACLPSCGLVPDHCGEAGSELHGKAFDLAFNPASNSHLRSCGSGSDWKGQGQAHENPKWGSPDWRLGVDSETEWGVWSEDVCRNADELFWAWSLQVGTVELVVSAIMLDWLVLLFSLYFDCHGQSDKRLIAWSKIWEEHMIQPLLPLSGCFWLKDLHFLSIPLNLSYILCYESTKSMCIYTLWWGKNIFQPSVIYV